MIECHPLHVLMAGWPCVYMNATMTVPPTAKAAPVHAFVDFRRLCTLNTKIRTVKSPDKSLFSSWLDLDSRPLSRMVVWVLSRFPSWSNLESLSKTSTRVLSRFSSCSNLESRFLSRTPSRLLSLKNRISKSLLRTVIWVLSFKTWISISLLNSANSDRKSTLVAESLDSNVWLDDRVGRLPGQVQSEPGDLLKTSPSK
jgi:hypothetical protein